MDYIHLKRRDSLLYNSWESLCKGGYYIIEDLVVNDIKEELKLNTEILKYVEIWKEPKAANDIQNNYLIIIQKLQNIPKIRVILFIEHRS